MEILLDYIEKISGYSFHIFDSVIKDYYDEEYDEGHKWYDCQDNMEAVSKFFPQFEIQVKGKGECGEIWEMIFKNGNSYSNEPSNFSESDSEEEIYIEINKQKY